MNNSRSFNILDVNRMFRNPVRFVGGTVAILGLIFLSLLLFCVIAFAALLAFIKAILYMVAGGLEDLMRYLTNKADQFFNRSE